MSGIPESRTLYITPLSPVHMGTDEDYTPTGYVIEGNALFEFDQRALGNLPPVERRKLDGILRGKANTGMLKQVQAFFYHNRDWLIPSAVNIVRISDEMAKLYEARVGQAANLETSGKEVLNVLEIERAFYNPVDRRLMLPGSGLKGAMRTALLDMVNEGNRPQYNERNRDLQQRLFQYTMRDLHKDPMRLVQLGDCAWHGPESLNSAEALFAVNRKKHPVMKDGREVSSQAEQRNLYQLLECAAPFRFRAFRGSLNITDPGTAKKAHGKVPELNFSFEKIASACNRFYRPIFEREIELLKKRGFLDSEWRDTVEKLLGNDSLRRRLETNDAFLLRVGRHSGAESVTLNGVRSIRIMKGKHEKPAWEPEAKTIWLATQDKGDQRFLKPFGWLLVEMAKPGEALPAWPEAEALMDKHNQAMSRWLAEVVSNQETLREKVFEQHIEAERRAREAAEREAKEKAEQERLAGLTDEERQIEALLQQLEQDKAANRKEPGGVLNEKRLALLEDAMAWENPELRKQAATAIRQTGKFLPWSKKRKKEVQEKLSRLENEN